MSQRTTGRTGRAGRLAGARMFLALTLMTLALPVAVALRALGHLRRRKSVLASLSPDGYQEATIVINGKYTPDTVQVVQGIPLRLRFLRKEDNPCSERVIFSGFALERRLPAFRETTVEFIPRREGVYLFTCQWGMYRGRLIVTAPDRKALEASRRRGQ